MRYDVLRSFDREHTPPEALSRWDAAGGSLGPGSETQNFIYRFFGSDQAQNYLRLTHSSHRTRDFIQAELDFVNYLARGGAEVAAPIPSRGDRLVEVIETPIGEMYAVAFRAVEGSAVKWDTDAENRKILFERGRTLGQIHQLSQSYVPPGPQRFHWYHDHLFLEPWEYFPPTEPAARVEYQKLIQFLLARSRTADNYGMVHGDFGSNNTLRRNGTAVAFDFD